jgi:hypothetical protein
MNKLSKDFYCNTCNKYYKSYQSLWNHNKKFHNKKFNNEPKNNKFEHILSQNTTSQNINSNLQCRYCNKIYKHIQSKNRHEKKCQISIKEENKKLKNEINELKEIYGNEINELKLQLKELINKKGKIHYKTLQKINNQQNNNINNIQNNIQITGFTKENLIELFSEKEKLKILKKKFNSLNHLIEYTHFNDKYPEFRNIKITNLNNNIAYKYDESKEKFIATNKDELIKDLVMNRMYDIEEFKGEVMNKMSDREKEIINKMLEQFNNNENEFANSKKDDIKFLIYNNCVE